MRKRCILPGILCLCLFSMGCGNDTVSPEQMVIFDEAGPEGALELIHGATALEQEGENIAGAVQDSFGKCMVKIYGGTLVGSGVILGGNREELIIATAGHVFSQNVSEVTVEFYDGYQVVNREYLLAENVDLALLRIPREDLLEERGLEGGTSVVFDHGPDYQSVVVDQDAYDAVQIGDHVVAMGSYQGVAEDAYAGVLEEDYVYTEDFGTYMMIASVPVKPGMSGGGLFDARGNLLGILCGVSEEERVAVLPLVSITRLLEIQGEIMKIL